MNKIMDFTYHLALSGLAHSASPLSWSRRAVSQRVDLAEQSGGVYFFNVGAQWVRIYPVIRTKLSFVVLFFPFLALFHGCITSRKARMRLRLDGPTFPTGFKCAGVLVTGEAIPTEDGSETVVDWQAIYEGEVCPYSGLSTATQLVAGQTELEFSLYLPAGRKTTVQVLGVETSGECPDETLAELLSAKRAGTLPSEIKGVYELGRQSIEYLKSAVIDIEKSYDPNKSKNLFSCHSGASGDDLFPYKALTLFPGDRYIIQPTGGTAPYAFVNTGSGTVDPSGDEAEFIAGPSGEDIVTISDSAQPPLTQDITFTVAAAITPFYWYSARQFVPLAEGAVISSDWVNAGSVIENLVPAGGAITIKRNAAPNGMPAVGIQSTGTFAKAISNFLVGSHSVLVVAKRLGALAASLFCMTNVDCTLGNTYSLIQYPNASSTGKFAVSLGSVPAEANVTPTAPSEDWSLFEAHFTEGGASPIELKFQGEVATQSHNFIVFNLSTGYLRLGGIDSSGAESAFEVAEVIGIPGLNTTAAAATLRAKYSLP